MKQISEIYVNPKQIRRVVVQREKLVGHLTEKGGVWSSDLQGFTYTGTYEGIVSELRVRENLEIRNTTEIWIPTLLEVSYAGINGNPDTFKVDDPKKLTEILDSLDGYVQVVS